MENSNDKEFKELSPKEVRDLQWGMRYFFNNHPDEDLKSVLRDIYSGWIYNSADYVTSEQITQMLLFYERLLEFMDCAHNYCRYLDRTVFKSNGIDR